LLCCPFFYVHPLPSCHSHCIAFFFLRKLRQPMSTLFPYTTLFRSSRDTSIGALYATLERLQTKGFVSSKIGEPTAERGGRAKRYFELTAQGRQVLQSTKQNLETLWAGVEL